VKRKRFSVEQIVAVLKLAEVGVPVAELIRQLGITEQTLYRGRSSTRDWRPIRSASSSSCRKRTGG
jgi:putative transposase